MTDSADPSHAASGGIPRRTLGGLLGGGALAAVTGLATASPSSAAPSGTGERRTEQPFRARTDRGNRRRPNLLVILADDLGWADLSCYGAPHIKTPHLDRLARQGVRFTNGYSASSTCSPTRFGLYTGRHPGRTRGGLAEPIADRSQGLDPTHPTLASLLKATGYSTAMIGKWHCGFLPDYTPTKSGWDEFFGNMGGALEYFSKLGLFGEYDLYEGDATFQDLRYYTTVLTDRAVQYVRRRHDAPWLLNLNFTAPHWPWLTEDDTETGADIAAEIRAGGSTGALRTLMHLDGGAVEKYAAMMESLDAAVGKVLDALRRSGQEENTLVLFASDNGGERFSYSWPLTGGKGDLREGGIRVPTILRWPARIGTHQVSHEPNCTVDWTATLLEVAGARPAPGHPLDGSSLAGYLLRGERAPERDLFWRVRANRALRRGDWKYYQDSSGADHLYDLAQDAREQADLARAEPRVLAELKAAWEKTAGTLLPYPD